MQAIFLDTETTGLDPFSHRLLEIAFKIVDIPSGYEKLTYQAIIKQPIEVWEQRDPTSVEVNGFTWEKVLLGKEESVVRQEIIQIFTDLQISRGSAVFICQNPAFDRNFFAQLINVYTQEQKKWPYHWLDLASMYWASQIKAYREIRAPFPKEMCLSKNAIAQHYQLPTESNPHFALNGVDHLLLCYRKVVGFDER
jgi:oligoribonuclease